MAEQGIAYSADKATAYRQLADEIAAVVAGETSRTARETIIVPDVHVFPGHIACDSASNSEIVVPVFDTTGALVAVLDVDSTSFAAFDEIDARGLEAACRAMMAG